MYASRSPICSGVSENCGYLNGYQESDAPFNTNPSNRAPTSDDTCHDLTALPSGSVGGIYEIFTSGATARVANNGYATEDSYVLGRFR